MNANQHRALDALGDATRRTIFERVAAGPRPVGDLARGLPVSRPAVSQHLKILKDAGLVVDRKEGNRRVYRLSAPGVADLRATFDDLWQEALSAFREAVEKEEKEGQ